MKLMTFDDEDNDDPHHKNDGDGDDDDEEDLWMTMIPGCLSSLVPELNKQVMGGFAKFQAPP